MLLSIMQHAQRLARNSRQPAGPRGRPARRALTRDPRRDLPLAWHDNDRAVRVMHHLVADRAHHQPYEPAGAP
jgi:hypothetical protein